MALAVLEWSRDGQKRDNRRVHSAQKGDTMTEERTGNQGGSQSGSDQGGSQGGSDQGGSKGGSDQGGSEGGSDQ